MQQDNQIRLSQLMEQLRRVLALNYPHALWLTAEIAQCRDSRGHLYLQLVEKDPQTDQRLAQADAVLWQNRRQALENRHAQSLQGLFEEGNALRLQVRVEMHALYGFKLVIEDIDLQFALGQMMLRRRQIIEALKRSGAFDRNKACTMPEVVQRIAVISSDQAAGWQDFRQHLLQNPWGLAFLLEFHQAAMQGGALEEEVCRALERIRIHSRRYDLVVLIRGGGSKLDLAWFDNQAVAEAIARLPIPLISGIGHDVDETVTDLVAWQSLKTPTAVASWILDHNLAFESRLLEFGRAIADSARQRLVTSGHHLERLSLSLRHHTRRRLDQEILTLNHLRLMLRQEQRRSLERAAEQLDHVEALVHQLDPAGILARGFSITLHRDQPVTSAHNVPPGSRIRTILADGELISITVIDAEKEP